MGVVEGEEVESTTTPPVPSWREVGEISGAREGAVSMDGIVVVESRV